jgi:hypothetical protein
MPAMKKKALASIIIMSLLAILLGGACVFKTATANPEWAPPQIAILSPTQNGLVYPNVNLTVQFRLFAAETKMEFLNNIYYSLDGNPNVTMPLPSIDIYVPGDPVFCSAVLYNVPNGEHTIFVNASTTWGNYLGASVTFTVANNPTPTSSLSIIPTLTASPSQSPLPSPSLSPTPTVPELTYCTLPIVAVFAITTAATVLLKKNRSSF